MRTALKKLGGQDRHRFEARVERFGSKRGYQGREVHTVLLRDVTCDGQEMTDHLWMTCGKWSQSLREGMRIAFNARVAPYEAGYRGRRDDWDLPPPRVDYAVQRPTQLTVLSAPDNQRPLLPLET